ncbi:glycerophosphodiester phosphodiesterase family protein [Aeromicrobium sp.]|uniref:glycerophosphodiester phosphodiesterase family protein n=1 Tax=Aeromicrobium sp. TaxID=1871063 RepID=UPI0019B92241|nr:glycerophosphodiester phosphodiesterase family protein [Aeromicrobium sp.]MBC7631659.1 glycerophosphodiester phosphodiesterase [Aeromicrobium sp.]
MILHDHPGPMTTGSRHPQTFPLVIGHRGAPGHAVEHSARSYTMAMESGADMVEPDLVPTADGHLLCRHENELSRTTNVKKVAELRNRRTTKVIDGKPHTGWFSEDLTLTELAPLRARERMPLVRPQNTVATDEPLLTLDDTIRLVAAHNRSWGTRVGLCLELKHAAHFASVGLPLDELLLDTLRRNESLLPSVPMHVEADNPDVLRRVTSRVDLPALQLLTSSAHLLRIGGLEKISSYARGVAVRKDLIVRPSAARSPRRESGLVDRAHRAGLEVFAWTLRNENRYLPVEFRMGAENETGFAALEYRELFDAGVDAVFSDHPDTAVAERDRWVGSRLTGTRRVAAIG